MLWLVKSGIGTKFTSQYGDLIADLAIDATTTMDIDLGLDLVVTKKGLSDLACHFLSKHGVSAIRRLRKTDNNRITKACGVDIVNRPDELQESNVGIGARLFKVKKIRDEYFAFIVECKDPKACTVLLRGASKDLLNEVKRNL
ncbi:T-complex protein 1 subunit gamma [Spatholobus suberectus]|nr:T-complex protein 1 subunit gamma [Spatholobus suberectus]